MAEIIVALDHPSGADALALVDRLPRVRWAKVGSVLMIREGPGLVRELQARGISVFLDLKWHDIPNTVAGAVSSARDLGVAMATVHTLGGLAMLEAASAAAGTELALVGVTVLTSHDAESFGRAIGGVPASVDAEVERLAALAAEGGLAGIVCSPHESRRMRALLGPAAAIVVPGIRGPGDAPGDQRRTATAERAVADGASHLVVGRPVTNAPDPSAALDALLEAACAPA
ncbi:MAG: orotidine-5'-phosphate decarboxylase [Gemmatimonadota bacterium]